MTRQIALFAFSMLLACTGFGAAEEVSIPADWDARIVERGGDVRVILAGSEESESIEAAKDMPLSAGDRVKTGKNGLAHIAISEASSLELGPDSFLRVGSLRRSESVFDLKIGHLVAKLKHAASRRFEVRTPTAIAAVRGTELGVEVVEGSETKTVVGVFDEGRLTVSSRDGTGERIINVHEETHVSEGQAPGPALKLSFLERRAARIKRLQERRDWLRRKFKKYTQKNRERMRGEMRDRREKARRMIQEKKRSLKEKGSRRREQIKQRRDRFRKEKRR